MKDEIKLMPETEEEEVLQNVRMIVGVWRGEVPLDRELGLDGEILDEPENIVRTKLAAELIEMVSRYEPRAKVKGLEYRSREDGRLEPVLKVEV